MSQHQKQRLYYVQIPEDFFTRHPHDMVGDDEEGQLVLLTYMKLLTESIHHGGRLRFSDHTPFTAKMLARKFHLREETVANALSVLEDLELISIEDDGTIVVSEFREYVGSITVDGLRRAGKHRGIVSRAALPQSAHEEIPLRTTQTSMAPKEIVDAVNTDDRMPPVEDEAKKPPSLDDVLKAAKDTVHRPGGEAIPDDFVNEWYDRMCLAQWKDTRNRSTLANWRVKLGYAWRDEKARRKERGESGISTAMGCGTSSAQTKGNFYFEGMGAKLGI